jgi:hypothetical protein
MAAAAASGGGDDVLMAEPQPEQPAGPPFDADSLLDDADVDAVGTLDGGAPAQ